MGDYCDSIVQLHPSLPNHLALGVMFLCSERLDCSNSPTKATVFCSYSSVVAFLLLWGKSFRLLWYINIPKHWAADSLKRWEGGYSNTLKYILQLFLFTREGQTPRFVTNLCKIAVPICYCFCLLWKPWECLFFSVHSGVQEGAGFLPSIAPSPHSKRCWMGFIATVL